MKDAHEALMLSAENGEYFKIDLKNRSLKVGKEVLIENGKCKDGYYFIPLTDVDGIIDIDEMLQRLKTLYHEYKFSQPSERADKRSRHCYFKALRPEQMTDKQLIAGKNRLECKAELEYYVLSMMLSGITWLDIVTDPKHWYYSPSDERGLILLREWF